MTVSRRIATIPNGGTTSNAIDISEDDIIGFVFPALTSGDVTFLAADVVNNVAGTYQPVFATDGSGVFTIAAATGSFSIWIPDLAPFSSIKIVSAAAQGAKREIIAQLKTF